jgi:hypothetical protein
MQRVLQQDPVAASQVEMLLQSCISEVRGTANMKSSILLMTHLLSLLKSPAPNPTPPAVQNADQPAVLAAAAAAAAVPPTQASHTVKGSRAHPHRMPTAANSGHVEPSSHETGSPAANPAGVHRSHVSDMHREDHSKAQAGSARGRDSLHEIKQQITCEVAVPDGHLAAGYGEDSGHPGVVASLVGNVLRLARLPTDVGAQDLSPGLKAFGATCMDVLHPTEWLVQLESLEAAVSAFEALPGWLEAVGCGRVVVTFAACSAATAGEAFAYRHQYLEL